MNCDESRAQLDTYLDDELPAEKMRDLDGHVRSCPACAADVLARVQMKRSVKAAGTRYEPSAAFRAKIQKQIAARPQRSWKLGWLTTAAVLATVLIAGAVRMYVGQQNLRREQLYSEIADLHVATLGSANPVDVVSTDRHTVKPWFQGRVPFTFNLPELQGTDFTLVGGRVTYLEQTPGAHLIFQIRKHQISVFLFPENGADQVLGSPPGVERKQTFNVATWTQDGLRYIVFGDAAPDDIQRLSALLKAAAGT
ncbi:MAG TPA: anti-sigma factor [Terriglobales bacterium]|nr:anti-sigma factor [Terriglobales bacterium]